MTDEQQKTDRAEVPTPGPWTVKSGARCYHVVSADTLFQTGCISFDGRGLANAHLISAAPELYEALKRLRDYVIPYAVPRTEAECAKLAVVEAADAAIAKAEGR